MVKNYYFWNKKLGEFKFPGESFFNLNYKTKYIDDVPILYHCEMKEETKDVIDGRGMRIEQNGTIMYGEWHAEEPFWGRIISMQRSTVQMLLIFIGKNWTEGFLVDGVLQGIATLYFRDESKQIGEYLNNKKNGPFKFMKQDGKVRDQIFIHGVLVEGPPVNPKDKTAKSAGKIVGNRGGLKPFAKFDKSRKMM
jgi:hypothetical protein